MVELLTSKTGTRSDCMRLCRAVRESEEKLCNPRKVRRMLAQEYAGRYYGEKADMDSSPEDRVSLNLLLSMVSNITPSIAMSPRAQVTTEDPALLHYADIMQQACNHDLDECDAAATFTQAAIEAMFGPAVFKTGITAAGSQDRLAPMQDTGDAPYVDLVDFDDYLPDMSVRRREHMAYEGDRFDVSLEYALERWPEHRAQINTMVANQEKARKDAASAIEKAGPMDPDEEFVPRIQLAEFYLPFRQRSVVMLADWNLAHDYLDEKPYEGPEGGPYDMLGYLTVPGCMMPLSKVASVYDLHRLINMLARKIAQQAERQKSVGVWDGSDEPGLDNINGSADGQWARVQNIDRFKEISLGGLSQLGPQAVQFFEGWFQRIAGNPDLTGGISAGSKTLGQDQMLMQAAGQVIASMRDRYLTVAKHVLRKLAWWRWTDPTRAFDVTIPVTGTQGLRQRWDPETREGDWLDYKIAVEPYGVRHLDPSEQYNRMTDALERVVFPLATMGAQLGDVLDGPELATYMMEQLGIKGTARFWRRTAPMTPVDVSSAAPNRSINANVSMRAGQPATTVSQQFAQPSGPNPAAQENTL
jgi:hypothetical protein